MNYPLSAACFRLLEDMAAKVKKRMNESPDADLRTLESQSEWRRIPYAILAPAGLYANFQKLQAAQCAGARIVC